jgi:hypothetical protein
LYGVAYAPVLDEPNCGVIFQLQPPASPGQGWTETTLFTFDNSGNGGCSPNGAPIAGPGGALYGTTLGGGTYGDGVFYELQPPAAPGGTWAETTLYNFDREGDGTGNPVSPTPGPNGSFYCNVGGGAYGFGALVQFQPPSAPGATWSQKILYNYPGEVGAGPVVPGPGGVLYGTNWGGPVIQLTPPAAPGDSWTETILYTLNRAQGILPNSLTLAGDGTLFGTALGSNYYSGGGDATVFQLTPPASDGGAWGFKVLHDFGGGPNLTSPLILRDGNLYGTVDSALGTGGTVFELQAPTMAGGDWTLVHLHDFTGGQLPGGTLVMNENGDIFGVTAAPANQPPGGTVYRLATK